MSGTQSNIKIIWILIALTMALGLFGSVLFTEAGQVINLPSSWLYAVYPTIGWVSILVAVIALYVLVIHLSQGVLKRKLVIGYVVVIAGMLFVTNFFVP